jgi:hypothetical protein
MLVSKDALRAVASAIRHGLLPSLVTTNVACADCDENWAQCYDHRDYSKPLDVVPVCMSCNSHRGPAKQMADWNRVHGIGWPKQVAHANPESSPLYAIFTRRYTAA